MKYKSKLAEFSNGPTGSLRSEPTRIDSKEQQLARMEKMGTIKRGCPSCKEFYDSDKPLDVFAPSHTPLSSCQSGKRPHCTCDACF